MSTETENAMKAKDRSNSSTKYGGQQNQNSDKNKTDPQTDKTKQGSGMNSPKPGEQDQSPDKKKYDVQGDSNKSTQHASGANQSNPVERNTRDSDSNKDVDRERHPEEQIIQQKEYKKDEQKFNDRSERA